MKKLLLLLTVLTLGLGAQADMISLQTLSIVMSRKLKQLVLPYPSQRPKPCRPIND